MEIKTNFRYDSRYNSEHKQHFQETIDYISEQEYGSTIPFGDLVINGSIGNGCFSGAYGLTSIVVNGNTKVYKKVLYSSDIKPFMEIVLPEKDVMNIEFHIHLVNFE